MSLLYPRMAFGPAFCAPVRNEFAPLFGVFEEALNPAQSNPRRHRRRHFSPRFDVKEVKEAYHLEGELPGIDPKDMQIEFTDEHTLTIKGHTERHTEPGTPLGAVVESGRAPTIKAAASRGSDASSVKSHQPTVEDDEALANASAAVAVETTDVAAPNLATENVKAEEPEHKLLVSERTVGSFHRSFNFPVRVDQDAVKASLKNGILSILVPKVANPTSRKINIE